jgi:hypothetical protein
MGSAGYKPQAEAHFIFSHPQDEVSFRLNVDRSTIDRRAIDRCKVANIV